jgi:CheY-like chemotaxis protein
VSNLHRNAVEAIRHARDDGRITVATRNARLPGDEGALGDLPAGPYIVLTVADTGPGMSDDTRARIFEPFFTTKEGGRGMGLAATYGIVAHHGGRITVESVEGEGTTFTVFLPATLATAARPHPVARTRGPSGAEVTVLLVDDEVAILSATRRLLERQGYTVLTAESGAEAVHIAQNAAGPIHAILLDLRMPGMSGSEAFDPLVAARPEARIIVCSGYDLDAHAQALLDRGAVAFVRKPVGLAELEAAISAALGRAA